MFNVLDQVFSKPFIEYFKMFAQQIEPSDDLTEWRLLYGGPKFLLTADKDVIFALSQMSPAQLHELSDTYLQYRQVRVQLDQAQLLPTQAKPPIKGLSSQPHPFLATYVNLQKVVQHQSIGQAVKPMYESNQIPQVFPQTFFGMTFTQVLIKSRQMPVPQAVRGTWTDEVESKITDDELHQFMFIFFNVGRVYEAEQLNVFVSTSNDQKIETPKLKTFTGIFVMFVTRLYQRLRQIESVKSEQESTAEAPKESSIPSQQSSPKAGSPRSPLSAFTAPYLSPAQHPMEKLKQKEFLEFCLQNASLCMLVC